MSPRPIIDTAWAPNYYGDLDKSVRATTNETVDAFREEARNSASQLINILASYKDPKSPDQGRDYTIKNVLTLATAESLTAGLIMSTLVDIPIGGWQKYGGFAVYDTDAKRTFLGVQVDDVYTHTCAKEMAIGVLKNSNATIAIAVTGNAMPLNPEIERLAEVFVGIAAYKFNNATKNYDIIYTTRAINGCNESENADFKEHCKKWYRKIEDANRVRNVFNARSDTARVNQEIRYYTANEAYKMCISFINEHRPNVPPLVPQRVELNNQTTGTEKKHTNIPECRFTEHYEEVCVNISGNDVSCDQISQTSYGSRDYKDEYINPQGVDGRGKRRKRTRRKSN
jgi:PncC family amidohydrolase